MPRGAVPPAPQEPRSRALCFLQSLGATPGPIARRVDEPTAEYPPCGVLGSRQDEQLQLCATKWMVLVDNMTLRGKTQLCLCQAGRGCCRLRFEHQDEAHLSLPLRRSPVEGDGISLWIFQLQVNNKTEQQRLGPVATQQR